MTHGTIAEQVSERQRICDEIAIGLDAGDVERDQLTGMLSSLARLRQDLHWELKHALSDRNRSPEIAEADRRMRTATEAIEWAEKHLTFALRFELARCVEIANNAVRHVVTTLDAQNSGAAA